MARTPIIPVRADEETKIRWQAAAAAAGDSLSEFVRLAVEERIAAGPGRPRPASLQANSKPAQILVGRDLAVAEVTPRFKTPAAEKKRR